MQSIVGNITDQDVREHPFVHACTVQALEPAYYRELAANFPGELDAWKIHMGENNLGTTMSALQAKVAGLIAPIWNEFLDYHYSAAFFHDVLKLFGEHIRQAHPDLEARLGRPLESLTVAPRPSGIDADVVVDCQFGINTPVTSPSRVRGFHLDSPKKLYNALLYMRAEEDDSDGGDLQICRFHDQPKFHKVTAPDDAVEVVDHVRYRANTFAFMVNSSAALHGVTPRMPTPHLRRYVNFLAELREPIFDLSPYQIGAAA